MLIFGQKTINLLEKPMSEFPALELTWSRRTKKPKKRTNFALNIQSSSVEDIRRLPLAQKKRTREDSTSSPEGQQDKRPAIEGQTEDNGGQWL